MTICFPLLCQKMKDDSDGDKKQQINHIQNLYGFNLFCQKRFDDSMQVFAKLGTGMAEPEQRPPVVGSVWALFFSPLLLWWGLSRVDQLCLWAEPQ